MITPDTKDWTWVVDRTCPECGYDGSIVARDQVGALLRDNARLWQSILSELADLGERPRPDKWSPLEYACHVRDVCRLFDQRLRLMLTEQAPDFPNWDQDATAVEDRYNEQDAGAVAEELTAAAETLADRFDGVRGEEWNRTGTRSDGAEFTVQTFARYFLHDPIHHIYDVTGVRRHPAT